MFHLDHFYSQAINTKNIYMRYTPSRIKNIRKVLTKAKKRIHSTTISHFNINESNNLNTWTLDNVKIISEGTYPTVQNVSSSNTLIHLPKVNRYIFKCLYQLQNNISKLYKWSEFISSRFIINIRPLCLPSSDR